MYLPCLEKSVTLTVDKINIREDLNFHLRFALDILFVIQVLRKCVPRSFFYSLHKIKKDGCTTGRACLSVFPYFNDNRGLHRKLLDGISLSSAKLW